ALGPGRLVAYVSAGTDRFGLDVPPAVGTTLALTWSSPTSDAVVLDTSDNVGYLELTPPDRRDWLLVVRPGPLGEAPPPSAGPELLHAGANPSRDRPAVVVRAGNVRSARLDVFDALGRRVYSEALPLSPGDLTVPLPVRTPGVYLCRLTWDDGLGGAGEAVLKLAVAR
ncbi:MAG TPA: T9SS type A sorting domain-containing protein, partial [Rubricoccaceae bacterium]